jgi:hypothetical protein
MPMPIPTCVGVPMRPNSDHHPHLREFYPSSAKLAKPTHVNTTIFLHSLRPESKILYFAALPNEEIKPWSLAYGSLENSGVARVNKDGNIKVKLMCPGVYINLKGTMSPKHMHFVYWDPERKCWERKVHTRTVSCMVA